MAKPLGVVIAAAGKGTRMNTAVNKQYLELAGKPVINYSVELLASAEGVAQVVVVAHPEEVEYCWKLMPPDRAVRVVPGGKERQESVYAGLKALGDGVEMVAVHDGARPLLSANMLRTLIEEASRWGAVIPAVPVKDTLKEVDEEGFVRVTLDRGRIYSVQTPQVFEYRRLLYAYERARLDGFCGTDDASLFERYCGPVRVVPGDYRNIKITTPEDLLTAEAYLKAGHEKLKGSLS